MISKCYESVPQRADLGPLSFNIFDSDGMFWAIIKSAEKAEYGGQNKLF